MHTLQDVSAAVKAAFGIVDGHQIDDADDEHTCVVCMERMRSVYLETCQHLILCKECLTDILESSAKCPLCNCPIEAGKWHSLDSD